MWPDTELRTFDLLAAPDGSVQDTGIVVPTTALILTYGWYVQTPEASGSNTFLDVGFLLDDGAWYTRTMGDAARGSGHSAMSFFSLAAWPGLSGALVYQARSDDWVEFRGRIFLIWTHVVPPGFGG